MYIWAFLPSFSIACLVSWFESFRCLFLAQIRKSVVHFCSYLYQQDICSSFCQSDCHRLPNASCPSSHQSRLAFQAEELLHCRHLRYFLSVNAAFEYQGTRSSYDLTEKLVVVLVRQYFQHEAPRPRNVNCRPSTQRPTPTKPLQ